MSTLAVRRPIAQPVSTSGKNMQKLMLFGAFFAIYVFWGSTYIVIDYLIQRVPAFLMGGSRFILAGLLLAGFALLRGAPLPTRRHLRNALITGAAMFLVAQGAGLVAQSFLPSGLTALLGATTPVWIILFGLMVPGERRPTRVVYIGLALCIVGVALPANPFAGGETDAWQMISGALFLLTGSIAWAAGATFGRIASLPDSLFMRAGIQMLFGGALMLLFGIGTGEVYSLQGVAWNADIIAAFLYLTIFGSAISYAAFFWLMQQVQPSSVGTHSYVNPVVAMLLGVLFAGEVVTTAQLYSAPLILLGVFLITSTRVTFRFTGFQDKKKAGKAGLVQAHTAGQTA